MAITLSWQGKIKRGTEKRILVLNEKDKEFDKSMNPGI